MCGDNPNLLPEVNAATCFSTLAFAFTCVTFVAGPYWPFGTVSVLACIFGVVGGAMVTCCGPMRRQEQTPGFAGRMQVSGALFFVGAAAGYYSSTKVTEEIKVRNHFFDVVKAAVGPGYVVAQTSVLLQMRLIVLAAAPVADLVAEVRAS